MLLQQLEKYQINLQEEEIVLMNIDWNVLLFLSLLQKNYELPAFAIGIRIRKGRARDAMGSQSLRT